MKTLLKHPWLFLIVVLPILAILGSMISLFLALSHQDQDVRLQQKPNSITALMSSKDPAK